jgi:anti-sigma B factor antagonist
MALPDWDNVLALEGEIDLHMSPRLERSLNSIIKKRPDHIAVDMSSVTFIDSSGLAVLVRALQNLSQYGGRLTISGMNENVRQIFEMARLDQVFVINPSGEELLAAD